MESKRTAFAAREFIACVCITILVPATVYRSVQFFVKPPEKVVIILKKFPHWSQRTEKEADDVRAWDQQWGQKLMRVSIATSLAVLVTGVVTGVASLGTSLILGACFTILNAYIVNWEYLSDASIFVSLLIAVLLLLGALWWYSRRRK